jgi:hypothetical protein
MAANESPAIANPLFTVPELELRPIIQTAKQTTENDA